MCGCKEVRFLGCLDQADRPKTLNKDSFGMNDALVAWTILVFHILNSFIDRREELRSGRAHHTPPYIFDIETEFSMPENR
jgi:hypothetical protein